MEVLNSLEKGLNFLFQEAVKPCNVKKHISMTLGPRKYRKLLLSLLPPRSTHQYYGWVRGKSFSQFHPLQRFPASTIGL